ncbi:hypothetical protein JCM11251_001613 [Rhodosporidiobolus azoricus]
MASSRCDRSSSTIGGGQGARESKHGGSESAAASTTSASPFDRLPDELVSHILCDLDESLWNSWGDRSLSAVCVSKRFARLAVPIWAENLMLRYGSHADHLHQLLPRPNLRPFVRHFGACFEDKLTIQDECAALSLLTNLRLVMLGCDLSQDSEFDEDIITIPAALTDALRCLRQLRNLDLGFRQPISLEDPTFAIGKDVPSLRQLKLETQSSAPVVSQLLQPPHVGLTSLDLEDGLGKLVESFRAAALRNKDTPLPLEHLACRALILTEVDPSADVPVFDLAQMAQVTRLSITLPDFFFLPQTVPVMPSVQHLEIEGRNTKMYDTTLFRYFTDLLRLFPSLLYLNLQGFAFAKDPYSALDPVSSTDFISYHPTLPGLLFILRQTSVKEFVWQFAKRRHRWYRTSTEDDWETESYTLEVR